MYKYYSISRIGNSCFLILLILSLIFYKERIGLLDNSFQTFLMLMDDNIAIMAGRWPAVVIRWIPFSLYKIGASLNIIMVGFSASYIIVHWIMFVLIIKLRQFDIALIQLLTFVIATSEGFYWCNSEQILGLSICLFSYAVIKTKEEIKHYIKLTLVTLLFIIIAFTHPLLIFPMSFILLLESIVNKELRKFYFKLFVSFVSIWLIKSYFFQNWYDTMKSNSFSENILSGIETWFNPEVLTNLGSEIFPKFHFLLIGLLILIFLGYKYKDKVVLVFTLAILFTYLMVLIIASGNWVYSFYEETNLYTAVIIIYLPILYYVNKNLDIQNVMMISVIVMLVISICRISLYSNNFSKKSEWLTQVVQNQLCHKVIINENEIPDKLKFQTWSLPYESIIHSNLRGINVTLHSKNAFESVKNNNANLFVSEIKTLPSSYFAKGPFVFPPEPYCEYQED